MGRWRTALLALAGVAAVFASGISSRVPAVRRTAIGRSSAGLRITQLSDLHLRDDPSLNARIAAVARSAGGDLVVLTGDVVDRPERLPALDGFLSALDAAVPVIATTGNWEHWAAVDLAALADVYARHGVCFLRDARLRVDVGAPPRSLDIVGLDDGPLPKPSLPPGLLPVAAEPDAEAVPLLVLAHHPATAHTVAQALAARPDRPLILAGHTHGGQLALFGWAPVLPPGSVMGAVRAVDGAYPQPAADVWVSRGIGASIVDLRWGVPSTVDVLTWGP